MVKIGRRPAQGELRRRVLRTMVEISRRPAQGGCRRRVLRTTMTKDALEDDLARSDLRSIEREVVH